MCLIIVFMRDAYRAEWFVCGFIDVLLFLFVSLMTNRGSGHRVSMKYTYNDILSYLTKVFAMLNPLLFPFKTLYSQK